MEKKSKQMGTNVENDSAVGDSEVFKPRSSIRRTMCPPRNRMSLEYELYSVPSQELPVGSEGSFRSRKVSLGQYFSCARPILLTANAVLCLMKNFY